MFDNSNLIAWDITVVIFGLAVGFIVGLATTNHPHDSSGFTKILTEIRKVTKQCEKSLPRDKVCEVVISAKVVY